MNKYDGLLTKVSEKLNIRQGENESEKSFKSRIIYSLISRLGYASLWDKSDDLTISVKYFKNKIDNFLKIYLEIYPEVKISANLSAELYDLYLKTGNIYHKAYSISGSIFSLSEQNNILFLRGVTPTQKVFMSGAGFYLPADEKNCFETSECKNFIQMFALQDKTLHDFWKKIIDSANWKEQNIDNDAEYLRMSPPFNRGYWQKNPVRDGKISLVRRGQFEPKNYYLYKFDHEKFLCCRLPDWRIYDKFFTKNIEYDNLRGGVYRQIACACLANYQILPPIKLKIDGSIVQVKMDYLLPPAELYLFALYSWPKDFNNLPHNFERIFNIEVFYALHEILKQIGYKFIEE